MNFLDWFASVYGPVGRDELVARWYEWLEEEVSRNPAVAEAEHHVGYAALDEDERRVWDEAFGDKLAVEITDDRLDRFLADNPDIKFRGVVDA